jgi:hypothetical protein
VVVRCFVSQIFYAFAGLYTFMWKRWLMAPSPTQGCTGTCHPWQEAILAGLCLLRSGAAEAALYDTMMANIERREHEHLPTSQGRVETAADQSTSYKVQDVI